VKDEFTVSRDMQSERILRLSTAVRLSAPRALTCGSRCSKLAARSGQTKKTISSHFGSFRVTQRLSATYLQFHFSREIERLHDLRRALAIYRMVFGQSRQEDLIAYPLTEIPEPDRLALASELKMDLMPKALQLEA